MTELKVNNKLTYWWVYNVDKCYIHTHICTY